VTVVAQVIEDVDPQATNMLFRIDDGTGRIDARRWLEQHESPSDFAHIKYDCSQFLTDVLTIRSSGKDHMSV
jgi:hypothetical protein